MTFIVGLHCEDGIVMCSDSLEADGYTKRSVQKLFTYEQRGEWGITFGASGSAAACTNFGDRLLELLREKTSYDRRATEKLIEATLAYMRQEYPDEYLSAIVALWSTSPTETRLYKAQTSTQCLSMESRYACVGLDVSLARFLLDCVFTDDATVSDGRYLATFVTTVMKEKADGVGGPTQLLWHRVGTKKWTKPPRETIEEIETAGFIESSEFLQEDLEQAIRQFCWARFPHKCRPAKR